MPFKTKNKPLKKKNSIPIQSHSLARLSGIVASAPPRPLPKQVKPMLATLTDTAFDDPDWLFETKWDGYRAIAILNGPTVSLVSRNGQSFNEKFYPVYQSLVKSNLHAVLDGEIVVIDEQGVSQFGALQNWRSEADGELIFFPFDILWLDGHDLKSVPLRERKNILCQLKIGSTHIRLSLGFEQFGKTVFEWVSKKGLEGMIAKNLESAYQENQRSRAWLKIKTHNRQEVVIGGYTLNEGSDKLFSSLLVGVYQDERLVYIGKIGTGFNQQMQVWLLKKFKPLVIRTAPFSSEPIIGKSSQFRPNHANAKTVWLKPKLICEVRYAEMTSDGLMRHASYQGLRTDKEPQAIRFEKKIPTAKLRSRISKQFKK